MTMLLGPALGGVRRPRRFALDAFPDPLFASLSLKRLRPWHGSEIVVLRRDSDNDLQGFRAGADDWLDSAAVMAWCGGASAYVNTLFDQEGGGRHGVSATAAAQPRVVNNGVMHRGPNGHPMMVFSGAQYLEVQNSLTLMRNVEAVTLAYVVQSSLNAAQVISQALITTPPSNVYMAMLYGSATAFQVQARSASGGTFTTTMSVGAGAWLRQIGRTRFLAGAVDVSTNGVTASVALTPAQNSPDLNLSGLLRVGANAVLSNFLTGSMSSVISARSTLDMTALNSGLLQVMP